MAEYQQGAGSPEQLPQGAATEVNDASVMGETVAPDQVDTGGLDVADMEPEYAAPPEDGDISAGGDPEEDDFLYEQPEGDLVDDARFSGHGPIPQDVMDRLSDLVEASRDPSAPPQLTLLVQLLQERLRA